MPYFPNAQMKPWFYLEFSDKFWGYWLEYFIRKSIYERKLLTLYLVLQTWIWRYKRITEFLTGIWRWSKSLENLDFQVPSDFNIAILALNTAVKHRWKSFTTAANPRKRYWNSFILKEKHTALQGWCTIEPTQYFLFQWMTMRAAAQAGDISASIPTCS